MNPLKKYSPTVVILLVLNELFGKLVNGIHRGARLKKLYLRSASTGVGKCIPNYTILPTPNGNKKVSDIKIGDYLFDKEGKPTKDTDIVVILDKKTRLEANVYKLWWEEWFTKLWTINWRWYLEYDDNLMVIHAPYSNNWVCQIYEVADWQVFKI